MGINLRLTDFVNVDIEVHGRGSGGFGVVYWGPDRKVGGRWRALKSLRPEIWQAKPQARADFAREALLWMSMWPHANLVPAEGIVSIDNQLYTVLTYAERGNLRDQISRGWDIGNALYCAQMIAAGLDVLHTPDPAVLRGQVVHRDLKPENVLFHESGLAQITDFGLASLVESSSDGQGTLPYMSPEQWARGRKVGPEADIYAFGIILYELLTGQHALLDLDSAPTRDDWYRAHQQYAPRRLRPFVRAAPESVEQLYQRCLAKNPSDRPTAREALTILQHAARDLRQRVYVVRDILPHTRENEISTLGNLATAYARLGHFDEALQRVRRVLAIDAHNPSMLATQANILAEQGRVDEALRAYDAALAAQPSRDRARIAMLLSNRATLLGKAKRFAEAEQGFAQAIAAEENDADLWHQRAVNQLSWALSEIDAQHIADARAHLNEGFRFAKQALNLDPGDSQTNQVLYVLQKLISELKEISAS